MLDALALLRQPGSVDRAVARERPAMLAREIERRPLRERADVAMSRRDGLRVDRDRRRVELHVLLERCAVEHAVRSKMRDDRLRAPRVTRLDEEQALGEAHRLPVEPRQGRDASLQAVELVVPALLEDDVPPHGAGP